MRTQTFNCHKIAEGVASGDALVSKDDICFYMIEPETGVVIEKNHALEGRSIAGTVLVFPSGKGSSVVQADGLYQLQRRGNAPKAMIIRHADTVLVASAIVIGIPVVNKAADQFYGLVRDHMTLTVNADKATITMGADNA